MATEAAAQPTNFTATFEIKVTGIRTGNVGDLTNVLRQVQWTLKGTEAGQSFELPQTTDLGAPDSENFVPLSEVTEANVVAWIEANETRLPSIKAHIQFVLNKEVAKAALADSPMPWAPVTETPVEPTPAP